MMPVYVPANPTPCLCAWECSERWPKWLGMYYPCGTLRWNPKLLNSAWPSSDTGHISADMIWAMQLCQVEENMYCVQGKELECTESTWKDCRFVEFIGHLNRVFTFYPNYYHNLKKYIAAILESVFRPNNSLETPSYLMNFTWVSWWYRLLVSHLTDLRRNTPRNCWEWVMRVMKVSFPPCTLVLYISWCTGPLGKPLGNMHEP